MKGRVTLPFHFQNTGMNTSLKWPRILVLIASIILAGALYFPIWKIDLQAPQYPEGLGLLIYANGLGGDVDVINGLNHYIGMKTLHTPDFIEFTILPYIIGSLILLGLIAVLIHRKKIYYTYIALFMFVAIVSMVDFYRWEYDYGHNLDPHAAIQVPGMSYQPPLIGYKQLLNFAAYSIPDIGGWLFIGSGVLLFAAWIFMLQPKWIFKRKHAALAAAFIPFLLQSCSATPQPVKYGSDACDHCKMTIMDKRFAAEWVTKKAKVFRFDDVHCLLTFLNERPSEGTAYVNDFNGTKELQKATELVFVKSEKIESPMAGHIAAVVTKEAAQQLQQQFGGEVLAWSQLAASK